MRLGIMRNDHGLCVDWIIEYSGKIMFRLRAFMKLILYDLGALSLRNDYIFSL